MNKKLPKIKPKVRRQNDRDFALILVALFCGFILSLGGSAMYDMLIQLFGKICHESDLCMDYSRLSIFILSGGIVILIFRRFFRELGSGN